MKNAAGRT